MKLFAMLVQKLPPRMTATFAILAASIWAISEIWKTFKSVVNLASKFLVCGTLRADLPYEKVYKFAKRIVGWVLDSWESTNGSSNEDKNTR
jgi:hypothetical protein